MILQIAIRSSFLCLVVFCFCGQVFGATAIDFVGKLAILTRWAARGPPGIIFLCMRESFGPSF